MSHDPDSVVAAIHDAAAHRLRDPSWCVNAAAIATHVMRELGERSWPVQCTVLHMNAQYAERVEAGEREEDFPRWSEAKPGDPYCVWAQAMTRDTARRNEAQRAHAARIGRDSLPGHVVTWVPAWAAYLDPSADQFHKPAHGIELEPLAWRGANEPPAETHWLRPDGGRSIIVPTQHRGFATALAWTRRGDDQTRALAQEALRLLRNNPPNGGREP